MTPPPATAVAPGTERRGAARRVPELPVVAPERKPPLQVVEGEPRRRRVRRRRVAPVVSLALVVGSLMAVVMGHALLDQGQVRLAAAQGSLAAAQLADRQVTLQVAQLETPQRIVAEATGQLHMVQPARTVQLPHVPLDKPLAAPAVGPAAPGGSSAPASTASTPPTGTSTPPKGTSTPATGTSTPATGTSTPATGTSTPATGR